MLANPPRDWQLTNFMPNWPTETKSQRGMTTLKIRETLFRFSNNRTLDIQFKNEATRARNKGPIKSAKSIAFGVKMGGEGLNHFCPS